jgi:hypothetical protein
MVAVPAGYDDLLERPLYGHLATTRPSLRRPGLGGHRGAPDRVQQALVLEEQQ